MKIIKTKQEHTAKSNEFKFDSGAWVSVHKGGDTCEGSWEYQSDEDDGETYLNGMLWIEDGVVVDYDGCFELPEEVKIALEELGIRTDQL